MKTNKSLHSVSVAGVVIDSDSRILVIKRADNGAWQIPGGVLEQGEMLEQGVIREILEETGVVVSVDQLSGVYKNIPLSVVALVYICKPTAGSPTVSDESVEVAWFSIEQIEELFAPVFLVRVTDALSGYVHSRNHDGISLLDSER